MKLLLTNDELHEVRGGSQMFIMDLAKALRQRGHEVALYSWLRGSLADELSQAGIPVVAEPRACGFIPDVIHAQHHLAAMTAIAAFPSVPALYHCHGVNPWQERPPVHPRILRYVAMAEAMAPWVALMAKQPREDVVVLPNSINLQRFKAVRRLGVNPRNALLFGNAIIPPETIHHLQRACMRCGITLDLAGAPFGNPVSAPEHLLPQYDLVFAIGRSALEALASGCAVILFGADGCGPMIKPDLLSFLTWRNFTVPGRAAKATTYFITREIRRFAAGESTAVTAKVRDEFNFDRTCDQLNALYAETSKAWQERSAPSFEAEALAFSHYLSGLGPYIKSADERFAALRLKQDKARERIGRLKSKLTALEAKFALMRKRLPGFLRNWLLRE